MIAPTAWEVPSQVFGVHVFSHLLLTKALQDGHYLCFQDEETHKPTQ